MINWAGGMWEILLKCLDPHDFWQLAVTHWGERAGEEVREEGKLCNWGGRESHDGLPRCWDVYVISPLNFSSTSAISPFLLRSFNLCQPLCVEWQRVGLRWGWTLRALSWSSRWMGRLCETLDHFLSQASRLIPNRPLPQSPFYSGHCMGVPEVRYYTPFLDLFPED